MTSVLKYFTTLSLIHCLYTQLPNYLQIQLKLAGDVVGIFFLGGGAVSARISILFYQFSSEIKKEKEIILVG